jgi:hypothetical protein
MAASLKGKRTPITTPPYQVPSVDITLDPPIFSLVTTFKVFLPLKKNAPIYERKRAMQAKASRQRETVRMLECGL